jgi:hypothetical protein
MECKKRKLDAVFSVAYRVAKTLDINISDLSNIKVCNAVKERLNKIGLEFILEVHLQECQHTGDLYTPPPIYRCFVRRKSGEQKNGL